MVNDLLFSDVGAALHTVTSSLSSISSLSSSIDIIVTLAKRILIDAEDIKMQKVKLDEIEKETTNAMTKVEQKIGVLNGMEKRLIEKETELKVREAELGKNMKKMEIREAMVKVREMQIEEIENENDEGRLKVVRRVKDAAEIKIKNNIMDTPNSVRLNIGIISSFNYFISYSSF